MLAIQKHQWTQTKKAQRKRLLSSWPKDQEKSKLARQKREGIYVYLWLIHVKVWQETTKFCKAIILQLKNKILKIYRKKNEGI